MSAKTKEAVADRHLLRLYKAVANYIEHEDQRGLAALLEFERKRAEAALAEANKRISESAEAYARLFAEKAFADKQLATAKQHETALFALAASLGQSTVSSEPPTEFILRQIATARREERERLWCGQCGQFLWKPGCGPTHAARFAALTDEEAE